jgi:hypothetical protein
MCILQLRKSNVKTPQSIIDSRNTEREREWEYTTKNKRILTLKNI